MLDQCLHQRLGCPSTSASARNRDGTAEESILGISASGVKRVDLKVQVDNPTGAVRLYKELGMREVALDGS